jgi:hypothetical protein
MLAYAVLAASIVALERSKSWTIISRKRHAASFAFDAGYPARLD